MPGHIHVPKMVARNAVMMSGCEHRCCADAGHQHEKGAEQYSRLAVPGRETLGAKSMHTGDYNVEVRSRNDSGSPDEQYRRQ